MRQTGQGFHQIWWNISKHTNRDFYFIYTTYIHTNNYNSMLFYRPRGEVRKKNLPNASALTHHTKSTKSLLVDTSLILKMMNVSVELAYRVSWIYKTNVSHHFQILKEWKNCRNYRIFSSFQGWHDFKDIIKWNPYKTALLT